MRAVHPVYRPVRPVRTTPPTANMVMDVEIRDSDIIDISHLPDEDEGADSDDSQRTQPYPEPVVPTAQPIPTAQPANMPLLPHNFQIPGFLPPEAAAAAAVVAHPVIPQTLVQAWLQVKRSQQRHGDSSLGAGLCTNDKCRYCTGGTLTQYYSLVERLVQLDRHFWNE